MTNHSVIRHHPLLVGLHWLTASLLMFNLWLGYFGLGLTLALLRAHMAGGMLILALTLLRLVVRWRATPPARVMGTQASEARLAHALHATSYVVVLLTAGLGFVVSVLTGLPAIVFGGSGAPIPPALGAHPLSVLHRGGAAVLAAFIALHVVAVFSHEWTGQRRLSRMWFGERWSRPQSESTRNLPSESL